MENLIEQTRSEITEGLSKFISDHRQLFTETADCITRSLLNGGKVIVFGNGISYAPALNTNLLLINGIKFQRPALPCILVPSSGAGVSGHAEQGAMGDFYSKQISALGNENDVAIGFTCKGESDSIIKGLRAAARNNMIAIGFCGKDSQMFKGLCDITFECNMDNCARINEIQLISTNLICDMVEEMMFKAG